MATITVVDKGGVKVGDCIGVRLDWSQIEEHHMQEHTEEVQGVLVFRDDKVINTDQILRIEVATGVNWWHFGFGLCPFLQKPVEVNDLDEKRKYGVERIEVNARDYEDVSLDVGSGHPRYDHIGVGHMTIVLTGRKADYFTAV